jgi:hypothetical protein
MILCNFLKYTCFKKYPNFLQNNFKSLVCKLKDFGVRVKVTLQFLRLSVGKLLIQGLKMGRGKTKLHFPLDKPTKYTRNFDWLFAE